MRKPDMQRVRELVAEAVAEDLGKGDLTTDLTVSPKAKGTANLVSREEIVVCGMEVVKEVLRQYDERLKMRVYVADGRRANIGSRLARIWGPLRPMLSAERVMLNFLQRLSGVATLTWKFVSTIRGTGAKIYDTRKTTPGWRELEKYAVRCGGGHNHRLGLHDAILIKDNHLAQWGRNFCPKLKKIVVQARKIKGAKFVAVEVDHVDNQLNHVLKIPGIDLVLLDNMGQWQFKHAVDMRNKMCRSKGPLLEASGNIRLDNVLAIAQCGVDRIAVGAITHSAPAVDIGLDR